MIWILASVAYMMCGAFFVGVVGARDNWASDNWGLVWIASAIWPLCLAVELGQATAKAIWPKKDES